MVSQVVAQAFTRQLVGSSSPPLTTWNGIPVVAIDTTPYPPEDAEAFIVVQFPVSTAEKPSLQRRYFEDGAARIVLNVTRGGIGLERGLEWADALAALFRTDNLGDGIETFAPTSPVIDDTNEDGNWYGFSIIVPYRYQYDG